MNHVLRFAALPILAALTSHAAPPTVIRVPTSGTSAPVVDAGDDGPWRITLNTTRSDIPTTFTIYASNTEDIEWIRLNAPTPQTVSVYVYGASDSQPVRSVGSISDITSTPQAHFQLADILTTGNVNSILVNSILDGTIGGNLTGHIATLVSAGGGGGDITNLEIFGEVQGTGTIEVGRHLVHLKCHSKIGNPLAFRNIIVGESIQHLECAELFAHIDLPTTKSVHLIDVFGGGSFTGTFAGSLEAGYLTSLSGMANPRIEVAGDLKATITLSGTQGLQRPLIVHGNYGGSQTLTSAGGTSAGGTITINGSCDSTIALTGTVNAPISIGQDLRKPLTISGDLNANVTIGTDLKNAMTIGGKLVAGKAIVIGAGTTAAGAISLGSGGLEGQVVINGLNGGASWVGDVTVGSTTLNTAPYYSNLPSAIGGGAVGLARYQIHDAACDPDNGGTVDVGLNPSFDEVNVEFYGPLMDVAGGDEPVEIHRKNIAIPEGDWINVTDDFDISVSGRVVTVTPKTGHVWDGWKVYRIKPRTGELKCLFVTGTPDVAADEYILYTVESAPPGDG